MSASITIERTTESALPPLDDFEDRTVFQTPAWVRFVQESQGGEPVYALIRDAGQPVGRFTGLVVRRYGLRILGSPMAGWTTGYMGFNLRPGLSRVAALRALEQFAWREVGCLHLEVMDHRLSPRDVEGLSFAERTVRDYEIDLSRSEEDIYRAMTSDRRWGIRKADKVGVRIEVASDDQFVDDYYAQLRDVFARQVLTPTYGRERVATLIRNVLPTGDLLLLRAVNPEGVCIGTGIFPASNDLMYFWGGASWRPEQSLCPNEAIQWYAMRYWKARGITRYHMGGAAAYKKKYGGREIEVPWLRKSRYGAIEVLRNRARDVVVARQRLGGYARTLRGRPRTVGATEDPSRDHFRSRRDSERSGAN